MRTHFIGFIILSLGALAACGKLDEGVNAHNVTGTVVIPKGVVGTNQVGMVYVGIYSGLDTRVGYPSPIAAPAQSSAGADTFPYGGSSIGTFANRDWRYVCQRVSGQTIRDGGANWELDFQILQFPFYEGAVVWAMLDQYPYDSCNDGDGYSDYKQILLDVIDAQPDATEGRFVLTVSETPVIPLEPTLFDSHTNSVAPCEPPDPDDPTPTYCQSTEFIDEGGQFWEVYDIDEAAMTITVEVAGAAQEPVVDGGNQARLFLRWDDPESNDSVVRYGTQFNDVLNFPTVYLGAGDYVSAATKSPVMMNLSPVTVEIDTPVSP